MGKHENSVGNVLFVPSNVCKNLSLVLHPFIYDHLGVDHGCFRCFSKKSTTSLVPLFKWKGFLFFVLPVPQGGRSHPHLKKANNIKIYL